MSKEIQSKINQNKRRWLKDWVFRGEEYVAPGTLFKELVAENPPGFKNSKRMDSEKILVFVMIVKKIPWLLQQRQEIYLTLMSQVKNCLK